MKKILVIEDNLEVRENLCEILELAEYDVISAANGKLGVEKALQEIPDLIVCDVMMPELDGFGVMKILNKNSKVNHIPLIFLTAKAENSDFRKGMGLGADDYITKPFDDTELLESIEIRLEKSKRINAAFDNTESGLKTFISEAKAQKELDNLTNDREVRTYSKKDSVYTEGSIPRWLYFVISGQVKIFQTNDYGKELTTQLLNPGDFFGYFPLITESNYGSSASATTASELRLIPKEDFFKLLHSNRDFSAQFIKMMANRAEDTEEQLIEMAYSSVRKKVANALLAFANNTEKDIKLSVSREELASKAGTAKESLIRTLSDFKSEGILEINSKYILIHDIDSLKNLIG